MWTGLGRALVGLERGTEALLSFQHALKLNPEHWDAAHESGTLLNKLGRREEALACFMLCVELKPKHASDEALTFNNVGNVLHSLGRSEEALQWLARALELRPDFAEALCNKAISLGQLRRFDEAFATYDRVNALHPDNAVTNWNLALLHLLTGNFEAGWAGREARWRLGTTYPDIPKPMWLEDGSIEGKTIRLGADEGLGDTIQFARYVPMVVERGARVVLLVQDPLLPLMAGLSGVSQCVPISAASKLPAFDVHCPLTSLPLAFGTGLDTIPAGTSYLPPLPESRVKAWEDRLGPS